MDTVTSCATETRLQTVSFGMLMAKDMPEAAAAPPHSRSRFYV